MKACSALLVALCALLGSGAALGATGATGATGAAPAATPKAVCPRLAADAKPADAKLTSTDALIFSAAGDTDTQDVTLQLPLNVDIDKTSARVLHVRRDKVASEALKAHFQPGKLARQSAGVAVLPLAITDIARLLPGAYVLLIQLEAPCKPFAPFMLTVERPAVALRVPAKLLLDVRMLTSFGSGGTAAPQQLEINLSDATSLSALRAASFTDGEWRSGGENRNASLQASAQPALAGKRLVVKVAPTGFPVGTTTGKLELSSPDLRAPVPIDVEVHARLFRFWIVVAVALGIGAGVGLRGWLPRYMALRKARVDGADVIESLTAQLKGIEDTTFRGKIDPVLEHLRTTWSLQGALKPLSVDHAVAITAAQDAAKAAVEQGLAELAPRLAAALALDRALREIARQPQQLPPPLRDAVAGLQAACDAAAPDLSARNPSQALPILDKARADLVEQLHLQWSRWQQTSAALDADLNELRALMDPARDAARGLDATAPWFAQQAHNRLATQLAPPDFNDLAAIARSLQAWRDYGIARTVAFAQWRAFIDDDIAVFKRLVGSRAPRAADLDAQATQLSVEVFKLLERLAQLQSNDPFGALRIDVTAAFDAGSALLRALCAACGPQANVAAVVLGHIDRRRFFDAVLALPYLGEQQWSVGQGSATKGTEEAPADTLSSTSPAPAVDPLPTVDAEVLELVRTRASRQLRVAQRWQTAVVATVTLGVSYAFFEGRFEGSAADLMGLFFWGLSVDLSVAGLTTLQTNLATAPKRG